jgi:hypothetical protein
VWTGKPEEKKSQGARIILKKSYAKKQSPTFLRYDTPCVENENIAEDKTGWYRMD